MVNWTNNVEGVSDGDALNAATLNAPIAQLTSRTDFLKDWLTVSAAGTGLRMREVPLSSEVEVGQPVYLRTATMAFELASSAVDVDGDLMDTAFCWGIVIEKYNATSGVVLLSGLWPEADLSSALEAGDTAETGAYFLTETPGVLSRNGKPMQPFIMYYSAETGVAMVQPRTLKRFEDHFHQKFELVPTSTASTSTEGWMSATGLEGAPSGAVYKYITAGNTELEEALTSALVTGYFIVATGVRWTAARASDAIVINEFGIWWMFQEAQWTPWGSDTQLPFELWLTNMAGITANTRVLSLQPATGSPLRFTKANGASATSGHLYAHLDLNLTSTTEAAYSSALVVKGFTGSSSVKGYVVGRVKSGSSYLSVSGSDVGDGWFNRDITLDLNLPDGTARYVSPDIVMYNNADQETVGLVPFHELPAGIDSSVTFKFDLPAAASTTYTPTLLLRLYATTAGTLPDLAVSKQTLTPSVSLAGMPVELSVGTLQLSGITAGSARYIDVEFPLANVAGGSTLCVKLARSSAGTYTGGVGIIRAALAIEANA